MPLPQWLRNYDSSSLRLDIVAGLSLAAFVIPEALAYASLADLPPVSGLYCYLVAGVAYDLFGTSRQLAVGPTSALAIAVDGNTALVVGSIRGQVSPPVAIARTHVTTILIAAPTASHPSARGIHRRMSGGYYRLGPLCSHDSNR